jgi:RNA polymerase-binding protein
MAALRGYGMNSHSYESDVNVIGVPARSQMYHCPAGHMTRLNFALEAEEIPNLWDCPKCGRVSHRDETAARRASLTENLNAPTPSPRTLAAGKTHWQMLLERRTVSELETLLEERLDVFRTR